MLAGSTHTTQARPASPRDARTPMLPALRRRATTPRSARQLNVAASTAAGPSMLQSSPAPPCAAARAQQCCCTRLPPPPGACVSRPLTHRPACAACTAMPAHAAYCFAEGSAACQALQSFLCADQCSAWQAAEQYRAFLHPLQRRILPAVEHCQHCLTCACAAELLLPALPLRVAPPPPRAAAAAGGAVAVVQPCSPASARSRWAYNFSAPAFGSTRRRSAAEVWCSVLAAQADRTSGRQHRVPQRVQNSRSLQRKPQPHLARPPARPRSAASCRSPRPAR
jgi:hypothetical protein